MSEPHVLPDDMSDGTHLSLGEIEAVIQGQPTPGTPDGLGDLVNSLRESYVAAADVPAGTALNEFLDVVDLTTTAGTPVSSARKGKLFTGMSAFIATTAGKIALGTAVAAASVGGVHAAELVDVPGIPDSSPVEIVEIEDDELDGVDTVLDAEENDDASRTDASSDSAKPADADLEHVGDDLEEVDENHGHVVSEFVHVTDLEGCEKGQAVAELASEKAKEHRQNDDDYEGGVDEETSDKCDLDDEDDDDDDEAKDEDDEDDDDDEDEDEDEDEDDEDDEDEDEDDEDEDASEKNSSSKGRGNNKNATSDDD